MLHLDVMSPELCVATKKIEISQKKERQSGAVNHQAAVLKKEQRSRSLLSERRSAHLWQIAKSREVPIINYLRRIIAP